MRSALAGSDVVHIRWATSLQPPGITTALLFFSINRSTEGKVEEEEEKEEEASCSIQATIDLLRSHMWKHAHRHARAKTRKYVVK